MWKESRHQAGTPGPPVRWRVLLVRPLFPDLVSVAGARMFNRLKPPNLVERDVYAGMFRLSYLFNWLSPIVARY
jgi:hypothetical protein